MEYDQHESMNIVCSCDNGFLPHTATMLCSLMENSESPLHIYLLHNGISRQELIRLSEFIAEYGNQLDPLEVDVNSLVSLKVDGHVSAATYYRLLIPVILPSTVEKVLYLDSDIIVRSSLTDLWNTDLQEHPIAAVEESGDVGRERLGIPYQGKYFNAGVLLINLRVWRERSIHVETLAFIRKHLDIIQLWDQDGLNAVMSGQWLELPCHWNVQNGHFLDAAHRARYPDIIKNPAIVHFTGAQKPWERGVEHPFKDAYLHYRRKTPWIPYRPEMRLGLAYHFRQWVKRRAVQTGSYLMRVEPFWPLAYPVLKALQVFLSERIRLERERRIQDDVHSARKLIETLVPDETVASGPFQGLHMAGTPVNCTAYAAMLLGTYEAELHPVLREICSREHAAILSIGCAEGYYAVGLARQIPTATVSAYDTDPVARERCRQLAEQNDVADRVIIGEFFTMNMLPELKPGETGFIMVDCGGAERHIFHQDSDTWSRLAAYDLLIEIHEFLQPGVSRYIYETFSATHSIQRFFNIEDRRRPLVISSPLIEHLDWRTKVQLIAEHRPAALEWYFIQNKSSAFSDER